MTKFQWQKLGVIMTCLTVFIALVALYKTNNTQPMIIQGGNSYSNGGSANSSVSIVNNISNSAVATGGGNAISNSTVINNVSDNSVISNGGSVTIGGVNNTINYNQSNKYSDLQKELEAQKAQAKKLDSEIEAKTLQLGKDISFKVINSIRQGMDLD